MITLSLTPAEAASLSEILGEKIEDLADRLRERGEPLDVLEHRRWLHLRLKEMKSALDIGVEKWNTVPEISRMENRPKDGSPCNHEWNWRVGSQECTKCGLVEPCNP